MTIINELLRKHLVGENVRFDPPNMRGDPEFIHDLRTGKGVYKIKKTYFTDNGLTVIGTNMLGKEKYFTTGNGNIKYIHSIDG